MPAYVFTCKKCGQSREHVCSMADKPSILSCAATGHGDGMNVSRCDGDMHFDWKKTLATGHHRGDLDRVSMAVGVMPWQREDAIQEAKQAGVPTHFDANGDAVFTSREHRRQYCKALGFRDNDAGYGDYSGE